MTYETIVKATGDGCEIVVTLSGALTPLTEDEIEVAKHNVAKQFRHWFKGAPQTMAVVANCPVQESDVPGNIPH